MMQLSPVYPTIPRISHNSTGCSTLATPARSGDNQGMSPSNPILPQTYCIRQPPTTTHSQTLSYTHTHHPLQVCGWMGPWRRHSSQRQEGAAVGVIFDLWSGRVTGWSHGAVEVLPQRLLPCRLTIYYDFPNQLMVLQCRALFPAFCIS